MQGIREYAHFQRTFHDDFAIQHRDAHRSLVHLSSVAFFITLLLAAGQFAALLIPNPFPEMVKLLTLGTLISTLLAFVVSLLAHQLGFEAISERSTNAAAHFSFLDARIERDAHAPTQKRLHEWERECRKIIVAEQHSWYRHVPQMWLEL